MATLTVLWHLHQPCYRTADGTAHAPWVAIHAGGSYRTLVDAILETGARGQVLNVVPSLIEQLDAYARREVHDPVLEVLTRPVAELDREARCRLAEWAFHVAERRMEPLPRMEELALRRRRAATAEELERRLGPGELRDLQVLAVLAHAGDQAWRDPTLEPLFRRGRRFTPVQQTAVAQWLRDRPAALLRKLEDLEKLDGVEISTSPYAHPIVPLLIDTAVVDESWAPDPAPSVPSFSHRGDAARQIREGLGLMRRHGFEIHGCWPPEGSVSEAAVELYGEAGVHWLVADEGILERSLDAPLRTGGKAASELYRAWRLVDGGPVLFFRDRELSDRIGFVYGRFEDETAAASDMVDRLRTLADGLDATFHLVLALDGENPWPHYPEGGGTFLRELFTAINNGDTGLEPATLAELAERAAPSKLPRLHPGSWIGGTFSTWIGHPEKSRAWALLASVRELLPDDPNEIDHSMLVAEGSDWFWWLGDDNPTALACLYDTIFRRHLLDACRAAGVEPIEALAQPLKPELHPIRVPLSRRWRKPVLDGRVTSYFEWSLAAWFEERGLRLGAWTDGEKLYLMLAGETSVSDLTSERPFALELTPPDGELQTVGLGPGAGVSGEVRWAAGRILEVAVPWKAEQGWRLRLLLGDETLPGSGFMALEPWPVDEEL